MILRQFADENAVEKAVKKSSSGLVLPSKRDAQSVSTAPASKTIRIAQLVIGAIYSKFAILALVYAFFIVIFAMNSDGGTEQTSLTKIIFAPWVQARTAISEQEARDKERVAKAVVLGEKTALLEYEVKSKNIELEHQQDMTDVLVNRDAGLKKTETVNAVCQQEYASNLQNADSMTELDRWIAGIVGAGTNFVGKMLGSDDITSWGDSYQDEVFFEGQIRKEGISSVTKCLDAELGESRG